MVFVQTSHHHADRFITSAQLQHMLGCSRMSVHRWVKAGVLPKPIKMGGPNSRSLFREAEVHAALAALR